MGTKDGLLVDSPGFQSLSGSSNIIVGRGFSHDICSAIESGFTGCGKSIEICHSERSEESLFDLTIRKQGKRDSAPLGMTEKAYFLAAWLTAVARVLQF
jgi:hypothetical protein